MTSAPPSAPAIDWVEIRRRLQAIGEELATGGRPSHAQARALLEERARILARPLVVSRTGQRLECITFTLANETYAIESRAIFEVFPLRGLARLPGAEPPVFGLTAWRGDLLTILDLRPLLGLAVSALNDLSRVMVLGDTRPEFGVLADEVHDVVLLSGTDIRPAPAGLTAHREYLRGMTGDAVLVLDTARLLAIRIHPEDER